MSANVNTRRDIEKIRKEATSEIAVEAQFICEYLTDPMGDGISYEQVAPEEVGALTSAPIISDGENIYGYMDYAVKNFLEELADGKTIVWQKG